MAISFEYIGWCTDTTNDTKHDKIWTAFKVGRTWYAGWGARGKAISFKQHSSESSIMRVKREKEKKYTEVDSFMLFSIFPHFEEEVEKQLMFATLCNKVR